MPAYGELEQAQEALRQAEADAQKAEAALLKAKTEQEQAAQRRAACQVRRENGRTHRCFSNRRAPRETKAAAHLDALGGLAGQYNAARAAAKAYRESQAAFVAAQQKSERLDAGFREQERAFLCEQAGVLAQALAPGAPCRYAGRGNILRPPRCPGRR